MTGDDKRYVLRAAGQAADEPLDEAPAAGSPATVPDAASDPSGSLAPVMISQFKEAPPAAPPTASERSGRFLMGLGGMLCCLLPTLPWFTFAFVGTHIKLTDITVPVVTGVRTWPGLMCLILGAVLIGCLLAILVTPKASLRQTLGWAVIGIGLVCAAIAFYAIGAAASILHEKVLHVTSYPWVLLTGIGGALAALGGLIANDL